MPAARSRLLPRIGSWDEYRRVFGRRGLWTAAVRRILGRHGFRAESLRETFPGTCGVLLARISGGRDLIVKIFPPLLKNDRRIEAVCLDYLARRSDIPAPGLVAQGRLRDRVVWEYLVLIPRKGKPLREVAAGMSRGTLALVGAQVGSALRRLHALPPPKGSFPSERRITRPGDLHKLAARAAEELGRTGLWDRGRLDSLSRRLTALASRALREPLVLAHADITEDHILLEREAGDWRFCGLIDFADSVIGPRQMELMPLWLGAFGRNLKAFRAFFSTYSPRGKITRAWRDQATAFTLLHQFGPSCVLGLIKKEARDPGRMGWDGLRDWLWPAALEKGTQRPDAETVRRRQ